MATILNTTPSGNSSYGPFSQTQVSVYCDESRHAGQSAQRYMVIGGFWLPRATRGEILATLRPIQQRYGITSELKWVKATQTKLKGYQAVVDAIAARPDIHFRCTVVDKSKLECDKHFQNDRQFGFWAFYWHCLNRWMGNNNIYFISIDFKPESLLSGPSRLWYRLERACVGRAWVQSLSCVDSRENLFCQLADVFIGAVGCEQNALVVSPPKQALAAHIAAKFNRPDLKGSDPPSRLRFNIWRIWP